MSAGTLDQPIEDRRPTPLSALFTADASTLPRHLALVRAAAPFALVAVVAFLSRLRYAVWAYHDTYASGDAHLILTKAMFIARGEWRPPVELGGPSTIFSDPPLIALLLGGVAWLTRLPLAIEPLVVTSALTIVALCALYAVARRAFDPLTALAGVCLVALIPRFSLDSTEPDKVAYVVSFFAIALFFLYQAQTRPRLYLVAGAFMGMCVFSHTTGYIFLGVYGLSHLALTRGSERGLFDRWFLAGLIIPLLCIGAYVQLNDQFQRTPAVAPAVAAAPPGGIPAPSATDSSATVLPTVTKNKHRFVPGSIQLYYDNLRGIAERGFRDSAWNLYFDAIRTQVTTPVYFVAVAGFLIAAGAAVTRRKYELVPLMLWMLAVTLAFAVQHPALSHRTRYPSYVTPMFVLFATYAVIAAVRALTRRAEASMRPWYVAAAIVPVVAFVAVSYARSDASGQRKLYAPHERMAAYVAQQHLLGDGSGVLYMAWPSTTFFLLDDHPELEPYLHTYGWGASPAPQFTTQYVAEHGIKYFEYDHTGSDYFNSSELMRAQLSSEFTLKRVETFCGTQPGSPRDPATCGLSYAVLYELTPKS